MEKEFQMSMMEELTFFLGIQVKQMKQCTFIHQAKYKKYLMKKVHEHDWLPPVPHDDTDEHLVRLVPVFALLGFSTLFTLDGHSVDFQVS
jgi:hypothetical protein